jgi:5-methylthioribose kinase
MNTESTPVVWDNDYARKVLLKYTCYHDRIGDVQNATISEIGDGNLNYIYVVTGDKGSVVLKIVCESILCLNLHLGTSFCSCLA